MKKWLILVVLAAAMLLAGCRGRTKPPAEEPASSGAGSAMEEPVAIGELSVELPREVDIAAARSAIRALPEQLASIGIPVERTALSFGTSGAATAEAVEGGGVQAAFLSAADYVSFCHTAPAVLADAYPALSLDETSAPEAWSRSDPEETGDTRAGTFSLICTAPTEYGRKLAAVSAQRALSWQELDHGRWGVLAEDSLAGRQCLELWLRDHYEDRGVEDLTSVTVYDGWAELLAAAAREEIDLLPLSGEARMRFSESWTTDSTRTAPDGQRGLGRSNPLREELAVLAATERLYRRVVVVAPDDPGVNQPGFAAALAQALRECCGGPAEEQAALLSADFAPIAPEDLNGVRRLNFGA